jgi:hypothetical protein
MVPRKAELLKQVERAIHRRGRCARVLLSHPLNKFRTGRVPIGGGEDVHDDLPLLRPALPTPLQRDLKPLGQTLPRSDAISAG